MNKYLLIIEEQSFLAQVGESIVDGIGSFFTWIGGKITSGIASGVIALTPAFVVVAIIGIYITMSGNRKLGSKISSLSFIIYVLMRVIFR